MPSLPSPLGDLSFTWPFYAALLCGYVLGSIPFGLLLSRLAGYGDIRKIGSGNIGATNVLRTGNKGLAALTLILDAAKGAAAVLIAARVGGADLAWYAGLGALLGHLFPIWLRFRGGKGVATALGILLATLWWLGLAACALWLAVAAIGRTSSLAALTALAAAPILAYLWGGNSNTTGLVLIISVLVWLRHHANIRRLVAGTEPRIGGGS